MAEPSKNAPPPPEDVEAEFQSSLEDVIAVLEKLERYFDTPKDLLESLRLAMMNKGHLRFLLDRIKR